MTRRYPAHVDAATLLERKEVKLEIVLHVPLKEYNELVEAGKLTAFVTLSDEPPTVPQLPHVPESGEDE